MITSLPLFAFSVYSTPWSKKVKCPKSNLNSGFIFYLAIFSVEMCAHENKATLTLSRTRAHSHTIIFWCTHKAKLARHTMGTLFQLLSVFLSFLTIHARTHTISLIPEELGIEVYKSSKSGITWTIPVWPCNTMNVRFNISNTTIPSYTHTHMHPYTRTYANTHTHPFALTNSNSHTHSFTDAHK